MNNIHVYIILIIFGNIVVRNIHTNNMLVPIVCLLSLSIRIHTLRYSYIYIRGIQWPVVVAWKRRQFLVRVPKPKTKDTLVQ